MAVIAIGMVSLRWMWLVAPVVVKVGSLKVVKVMVWLNELVDSQSYVKSEKRVMFFIFLKRK